LPARVLVISAGVLMNFAFAFVTFAVVGAIWGVPVTPPPVIGGITEDLLPAGTEALAHVPRGTRILAIGDQTPGDFGDVRFALGTARPGPLVLRLEGREPVQITVPDNDSLRASLVAAVQEVLSVPAEIHEVMDDGAAARADLRAGDRVRRAGGRDIATWQEFVEIIETNPGVPVSLTIERDGRIIETAVTPEARVLPVGTVGRIGIGGPSELNAMPRERVGPLNAVAYGGTETWRWTRLTVQFIGGIFRGRQSARDIGGPIAIAQISGQAARAGLETFLNFMALLSVNLAVLNLLPIPVLDGGHLVFLGIEAVRGRALTIQQRMRLSQVGFVLILALMIFAIGNDVLRWLGL
jgi:regulator of sigma E protease